MTDKLAALAEDVKRGNAYQALASARAIAAISLADIGASDELAFRIDRLTRQRRGYRLSRSTPFRDQHFTYSWHMPVVDNFDASMMHGSAGAFDVDEFFLETSHVEHRWFVLRLVMGYSAVVLLAAMFIVSVTILFKSATLPVATVIAAGAALVIDGVGFALGFWKVALDDSVFSITRRTADQPASRPPSQ